MLVKLPEPSLDSWTIIFLVFAFQALVTGTAFCLKSSGTQYANRFIAFMLFLFALTLISYTAFRTGYIIYFPFLGIAGDFSVLLFGPLFYFYLQKLLNGNDSNIRYWIHILPAGLYAAYFSVPFFMEDKISIIAFVSNPLTSLLPLLKIVQLLVYGVLCYILVLRSDLLREMRKWALLIFGFYLVFTTCLAAYYLLAYAGVDSAWGNFVYVVISVFLCFVAVFAYIQPRIFDGLVLSVPGDLLQAVKYKSSGLTAAAATELFELLQAIMQSEKLYRQNDRNLALLAEKLNSNRHHLSQVINEKSGMNFYEFINEWRIKEARELLAETDLTVIEVAHRVGYNNKVSFNNAFKKFTGLTPSDYRGKVAGKGKS